MKPGSTDKFSPVQCNPPLLILSVLLFVLDIGIIDTSVGRLLFNSKGGVFNVGNPVFTCAIHVPVEMPSPVVPEECLPGYSCQPVNILYRTTSSEYGSLPPTCYSVPSTYHPMSQEFSEVLGKCGMPRNHSLNCGADKSRVPHH